MNNNITPAQGELAHSVHQQLLQLKDDTTVCFYRLGELMKEVRDKKLWEVMGYDSMRSYMASPELSLDESTVFRAIKTVESFSGKEKLAHVPLGKIYVILPHVTKDNEDHLLEMATSLSRSDLVHQLHETVDEDTKQVVHSVLPLPKIYRCNTCKRIKGIRWDDLCHCGWTPPQIDLISRTIEKIEMGE